jgi:hypothetical protein
MNKTLSVILPFFHKSEELQTVFPLNKPYLLNAEIVLCLDEADSMDSVLNFVQQHPDITWKVLVNRTSHAWRAPTKAINVGLRHCSAEYVLVVSPESKFVGDLPTAMLNQVNSTTAIIGKLTDCSYRKFVEIGENRVMEEYEQKRGSHYYGSICFPRQAAIAIGGYDECLSKWGGDDDNFRARLRLNNVRVVPDKNINIIHLTMTNNSKRGCDMNDVPLDDIHCPKTSICSNCFSAWGQDFDEMIFSSDQNFTSNNTPQC